MPIVEVSQILNTITNAITISESLGQTKSDYDNAHLKQELLKLTDALHEAKAQIRSLDDELYEKNKLIRELQDKLNSPDENVGFLGARYKLDEKGEPTGIPFCPTCWATDKKLIPLTASAIDAFITRCSICGASVERRQAPSDASIYIKKNRASAAKLNVEFQVKVYP